MSKPLQHGSMAAWNNLMREIKAVVFDWAGTTVDFGSFAPMKAFVAAFEACGVQASLAQARAPMGLPKWDHINAMLNMPPLAKQWTRVHGATPTRDDVDRVNASFIPTNERVAAEHAERVPGCCWMPAKTT
ncbi:MAG: hypothetical protein WA888_19705 [Burkholderiaceae bacterium]